MVKSLKQIFGEDRIDLGMAEKIWDIFETGKNARRGYPVRFSSITSAVGGQNAHVYSLVTRMVGESYFNLSYRVRGSRKIPVVRRTNPKKY